MPEITPSRYMLQATWEDVPHLTEKAKSDILSSTLPHTHDARSKGTPSLGSGAIYPIPISDIKCKPFRVPDYWPRVYGMDVGWVCTAAAFLAHDRDTDIVYQYSEHYRGQAEPSVHATGIKARGEWLPGAIDPASRGRNQIDGRRLMVEYQQLGLQLFAAAHAVDAGLLAVLSRLGTGRLKIFDTCQNTLAEYPLYRRDKDGSIIKTFDHAMDALRYGIMCLAIARLRPVVAMGGKIAHIADPNVGL